MDIFDKLIDYFGSQNKLAGTLDVSSVAVGYWFKEKKIPPYRAIQIERLTEGEFKAQDLIGE